MGTWVAPRPFSACDLLSTVGYGGAMYSRRCDTCTWHTSGIVGPVHLGFLEIQKFPGSNSREPPVFFGRGDIFEIFLLFFPNYYCKVVFDTYRAYFTCEMRTVHIRFVLFRRFSSKRPMTAVGATDVSTDSNRGA